MQGVRSINHKYPRERELNGSTGDKGASNRSAEDKGTSTKDKEH